MQDISETSNHQALA